MMERAPIRSVAIAGHGLEAWLVAVRLKKALPGIQLTICPADQDLEQDHAYTILPMEGMDCPLLPGIGAHDLVRECAASFSLGTRYHLDDRSIDKPYGPVGSDWGGTAFHTHWARSCESGKTFAYHDGSAGSRAMRQNRFAPPANANKLGELQHVVACHVDTEKLRENLRRWALQLGVRESVDEVTADLYLDCTGPPEALLKATVEAGRQQPLSPFNTAARKQGGWHLNIPRCDSSLELGICHDIFSFVDQPWRGKRLSLGLAACTLIPLDGLPARFLALCIDRLLSLMPGASCAEAETREYNHLFEQECRDLHRWHALLQGGEAFDDSGVRLFRKRGWLQPTDGQLISGRDWASQMILLGILPGIQDPLAYRLNNEQLLGMMKKLDHSLDAIVADFPSHDDYVNAVLGARKATRQERNSR